MKLRIKWMILFCALCVYAIVLGGIFYNSTLKQAFEERLKQDVLDMVRMKSTQMTGGLARSPKAITFEEFEVMDWLRNDKRITELVYFNSNGTVRWHKSGQVISMPFDDYNKQIGFLTDAVQRALDSKANSVVPVPGQPLYDMAIPLKGQGDVILGILIVQVSAQGARQAISASLAKFVMVSTVILAIFGVCMYFFMGMFVVAPIAVLKSSIDNVSTKNFELKFPKRGDEVGALANSVSALLGKVRSELDNVAVRDTQRQSYEQQWWQSILDVAVARGSKAVVVDEDNSVLFSNFEVASVGIGQKVHLLDIIDNQQQDVLRFIGSAMENPRKVIEGDTVFRGESCHVKAVQLQSDGNVKRTLVVFEPRR